jgi:hypothetical protein
MLAKHVADASSAQLTAMLDNTRLQVPVPSLSVLIREEPPESARSVAKSPLRRSPSVGIIVIAAPILIGTLPLRWSCISGLSVSGPEQALVR